MSEISASPSKVILITGASRGIGRHLAETYANRGHQVIGLSRGDSDLKHARYTHFKADVASEEDLKAVFSHIRQNVKRLDVLLNNAAVNPSIAPVAMSSMQSLMTALNVNVLGTFLTSREAVKVMSRNRHGRIINFGSMAVRHEVAGEAIYTATKAAITAFTRVLAKETAPMGITCNVLSPSAIETDLSAKVNQVALKEVLSRNAIQTYGVMGDVVNAIDMLIDEKSQAITGQVIYLGGV